ncbi:FG-GAP repeat protein [Natrinema marinum]|uniref:FG-GAP repeat protein n=1 Tax=Natrinema marinum TaxID=2961598 RepID=UPI0020C8357A|nr:FG-GAP repeat protein [Natrinema marinum]
MGGQRREFLASLGVTGISVLAGCSSSGGDDGPGEGSPQTDLGEEGLRTQTTKIAASDGDSNDDFGGSVSLSTDGSTALVGATYDEDPNGKGAGSAYVFEASGDEWSQQAKLAPNDGDSRDYFGASVSISADGTVALVGAVGDEDPNGGSESAGSAYVFEASGDGWSQQAKLAPTDGDPRDGFGWEVSISADGSTALISAVADEDPNGLEAGSAYIFESNGDTWSQRTKLAAEDGSLRDEFGTSTSISADGTTALVGAIGVDEPNGSYSGVAYIFVENGDAWSQQAKLAADDGKDNDEFGSSVSISADGMAALVGAAGSDGLNGNMEGSAYYFESDSGEWRQQAKLAADDGQEHDEFGSSVSMTGDGTALIGARFEDMGSSGDSEGSAYLFKASGDTWNQQAKLAAEDRDSEDMFGDSVSISTDGTAIISAPSDEDPNGKESGSAYIFD